MDHPKDQTNQMVQSSQPARTDHQRAQTHQTGILTKMPLDIVLHLYKSLHSFADLKALIQTSSRFNRIWLQNVSFITKSLLPTITNYSELAEDIQVIQDLHDQEPRPGPRPKFSHVTYEKNMWNRIFDFLVRKRDLIKAHCDMVDDTPAEDIIRHIDLIKERVENKLAKLDQDALAKEEAILIKNKSVANMDLLQHAERLIAIERKMRKDCEIFSEEMRNCFRKALPHHPVELSDEETDRFMKAAYRVLVMEISERLYDRTLAQAINAPLLGRLRPDEEYQLMNVNDWQLFVRFCSWEYQAVNVVRQRKEELRWRPRRGKAWKSKKNCDFTEPRPFHFYTKELLRSMVDAEWMSSLDQLDINGHTGNGDLMEVDNNDDGTDDSDNNDSDYDDSDFHDPDGFDRSDDDDDDDDEDEDDDNDESDEEMEHVPHEGPCLGPLEWIMRLHGFYDRHPRESE